MLQIFFYFITKQAFFNEEVNFLSLPYQLVFLPWGTKGIGNLE